MTPVQAVKQIEAVQLQVESINTLLGGLLEDLRAEEGKPEQEAWVGVAEFCRLSGVSKSSLYNYWARSEGPPGRRRGRNLEFPLAATTDRDLWTHKRPD